MNLDVELIWKLLLSPIKYADVSYLNNNSGTLQVVMSDAVVLPNNRLRIRVWL